MNVDLKVGTFTPSLMIDLARSSGRLLAAGISVKEFSVASSPAQFASLQVGDLDIVMTSPDNAIAYRFLALNPLGKNLPVEIVGAVGRGLGLSLWIGPEIDDVSQVRGGSLAVDVPQSGFAFVAYALLDQVGIPPGDYGVVSYGATPRRAESLIKGEFAATVLNAGNEHRAQAAGCRMVNQVTDIGPYLGKVMAALATDDPNVMEVRKLFTEAILAVSGEILSGDRDADVIEASIRLFGLSSEEAKAHLACLKDRQRGLVSGGQVDAGSIATLIELRRKYSPTPELDTVAASWSEMLVGRARNLEPKA